VDSLHEYRTVGLLRVLCEPQQRRRVLSVLSVRRSSARGLVPGVVEGLERVEAASLGGFQVHGRALHHCEGTDV